MFRRLSAQGATTTLAVRLLKPILAALIFAALAIAASTVEAQDDTSRPADVIRIASEGARPPFNYIDNNELAGFEIDLGRALCTQMHVTCVFVTQDWDGLIVGLRKKQFDAIMAAMEITDARREKIDFSKPYVRMPAALITSRRANLANPSPVGLADTTIGVEADGPYQAFLQDKYKKSDIRRYSSMEDAELDLAEGRIDSVIGDKDALAEFLHKREGRCCRFMPDIPRDATYFGDGIAIGLRKSDTGLKARFDAALDALVADGSFAKIAAKYFDFAIN